MTYKHIYAITHKAHARAKLILRCFSSRDRTLLVKAFCTYVRPLLKYCTPVWTPPIQISDWRTWKSSAAIHKTAKWTPSFVIRWSSPSTQSSLERRRVNYDLILVYKMLHGLTDCTLSHNLTLQEFNKTRDHPYKLVKSFCSHDISRI